MSQHEHHSAGAKHDHDHGGHQHGHPTHKRRPLHHDWRLWVGVVLMLGAMAMYVLSFDEALGPAGEGQPVPGAPAPPPPSPVP